MTLSEARGASHLLSNSEAYFRSFCLAFINARGSFLERKRLKSSLYSAKKELGLSQEEARFLFRRTASDFEDGEKNKNPAWLRLLPRASLTSTIN